MGKRAGSIQVYVANSGNFMRSNTARYSLALILIHWSLALMILAAHGMAFVLVGLIFAHIGVVGLNIFKHPGIASRMLLV